MSYQITIENKYGDQLELTHSPNYMVKATGLNPVASNIITSPVANYGGERYVSSRQQKRNIVLTIFVREPVEANRINLYTYIKSHEWIRVYFKNNSRDVYIDGYVEAFDLDHFSQTQTAQVSIICPQPNFIDVINNEVNNNEIIKGFHFKFNTGLLESSGTELEYSDLPEGTVRFINFLARAETDQAGTPSPDSPVDISGMGFFNAGSSYTQLTVESSGVTNNITIPLGEQSDGLNLIYGAESLLSPHNHLITDILMDETDNILLDENGNVIYE